MPFEDREHKSATIRLEDANSGSKRFCFGVSGDRILPMTATPDGRFLAGGTRNPGSRHESWIGAEVYVWDLTTGVVRSQFRIAGPPDRLELSPDGRLLAAWWLSEAMTIQIWDVESRRMTTILHSRIKASLSDVKFSPDG
jgi:hypothetical protein